MKKINFYSFLAILILLVNPGKAQTCSCAGNPSFNPFDQSLESGKKWYFEFGHRYHVINELVRGSKLIENDINRKRNSTNIYIELRHVPFKNVTFSIISGVITQYRRVGRNTPGKLSNIGDTLISIQYSSTLRLSGRNLAISAGAGIKIPTGESEAVLTGLAAEDMQPGTGSSDLVFRNYFSFPLFLRPFVTAFAGTNIRINGTNSRSYKFGNEINIQAGLSIDPVKNLTLLSYSRYRRAAHDRRFEGEVPNTGGKWVYIGGGFIYKFSINAGFRTAFEIPLYRKLNGAEQFTSKLITSVSVFYSF